MSATEKLTYAAGATKKQAIANADAQLADAGLPTYTELATAAPSEPAILDRGLHESERPVTLPEPAARFGWLEPPPGYAFRKETFQIAHDHRPPAGEVVRLYSEAQVVALLASTPAPAAPSEPVALNAVADKLRADALKVFHRADAASDVIEWYTGSLYAMSAQPSAKPAGKVEQAAALKQLIGSQVNYPHTPRSKAWFTEVCAAVDALATPPAALAGLTDADSPEAVLAEAAKHLMSGRPIKPGEHLAWAINEAARGFATTPAPVKAVAPEAGGFVRLSKHSDHGKPYRAFTHAQEQARAELAPAIAALIVRDVCETDPADPADPNTVSVNVDVLSEIVSSNLTAPPAPPAAQGAPVEHGQLDPRTATEQARAMVRYCQSFNGQPWGGVDESVDRKNLAVAIDNLEETSAMLLNMAERVAAQGAPVMAEAPTVKDSLTPQAEAERVPATESQIESATGVSGPFRHVAVNVWRAAERHHGIAAATRKGQAE